MGWRRREGGGAVAGAASRLRFAPSSNHLLVSSWDSVRFLLLLIPSRDLGWLRRLGLDGLGAWGCFWLGPVRRRNLGGFWIVCELPVLSCLISWKCEIGGGRRGLISVFFASHFGGICSVGAEAVRRRRVRAPDGGEIGGGASRLLLPGWGRGAHRWLRWIHNQVTFL